MVSSKEVTPIHVTITDPDGDKVGVEAWWNKESGTRYNSLLRKSVCGCTLFAKQYCVGL